MMHRPDGRPYRPRKPGLRVRAWETEDAQGLIVFGTLDPESARERATEVASYWYGGGSIGQPTPGWYRDTFRYGSRQFAVDERRGSAGVSFVWSDG